MKNTVLSIGLCLLLNGCFPKGIEKPEHLIKASTMENILYDIALFNAINSMNQKKDIFKNLNGRTYVQQKYGVDSLQLIQSEAYYASYPRIYIPMHYKVIKRIDFSRDSIELMLTKNPN